MIRCSDKECVKGGITIRPDMRLLLGVVAEIEAAYHIGETIGTIPKWTDPKGNPGYRFHNLGGSFPETAIVRRSRS